MSETSGYRYDLLTDPLIRVRRLEEEQSMSLPEVLEALGGEDDLSFPALRRHQRHAWHAFLVQLAGMALHSAGERNPTLSAKDWAVLLRQLGQKNQNVWRLVVNDLSEPAFMQPPVPNARTDGWKAIPSPGALDLLVTAKNHDVKSQLIPRAEPEHWILALISLQTMEGFLGAGNYGVARMNGGFSSRPGLGFSPSLSLTVRFTRDTKLLLSKRDELTDDSWPYPSIGGHTLLWTLPWDGTTRLDLAVCDPYFIEVCRRVRLVIGRDGLSALGTSTNQSRINAKEVKGVTGDPWTPVLSDKDGLKALTVQSTGFHYGLLRDILFSGEYQHGITWRQEDETHGMFFLASALARGQGKTEGLHNRELRIPAPVCGLMSNREGLDSLASTSKQRLEIGNVVRRKVLHMALCQITQGAPDGKLNFRDNRTKAWLSELDREIDAIFFERLFAQIEMDDDQAADAWTQELLDLALEQLEDALRTAPQPSIRRYRIESAARGMFTGLARKHFPDLFSGLDKGAAHV